MLLLGTIIIIIFLFLHRKKQKNKKIVYTCIVSAEFRVKKDVDIFLFLEILEIYVSALNFLLTNGFKLFEKLFKQSTQANIHFENHKTSQLKPNTMNFLHVTMLFGWVVFAQSLNNIHNKQQFSIVWPRKRRKKVEYLLY